MGDADRKPGALNAWVQILLPLVVTLMTSAVAGLVTHIVTLNSVDFRLSAAEKSLTKINNNTEYETRKRSKEDKDLTRTLTEFGGTLKSINRRLGRVEKNLERLEQRKR